MTRLRNWLWLVAAVVLVAGVVPTAQTPQLREFYRCEGVSPEGKPYRAYMQTRSRGDLVEFRQLGLRGDPILAGQAMIRDGYLVGFIVFESTVGGVGYRIDTNSLVGAWFAAGAHGYIDETCTAIEALPNFDAPHGTGPRERA